MSDIARANHLACQAVASTIGAHAGQVIVCPGGRSGPLALALARALPNLKVVLDERAAAFCALGWSRASQAPVAMLCTSGSAGAHALPALIEAWHSRLPLIIITADRPPELQGRGAPQTTEQTFFGGYVAARIDPGAADRGDWGAATARAYQLAIEHARPVQLNLSLREPLWYGGAATTPPSATDTTQPRRPLPAALPKAALASRRGVIHCGDACGTHPELPAAMKALGAALGWPVIAEATSGARSGAAHAAVDLAGLATKMGAPEVVLRFGRAPLHRKTRAWLASADHTYLVDPYGDLHHPEGGRYTLIKGDAHATALRYAHNRQPSDWQHTFDEHMACVDATVASAAQTGWWEGRVARDVAQAATAAGARLHVANSMPIRDLDLFGGDTGAVYASRGINGIDGTVATATGEALAGSPVWLLTGDLSLLHDASSLPLAERLGAHLRVFVVDNAGGGIFHQLPFDNAPEAQFERVFGTPQGLDCGAIAGAYGLGVAVATDPSTLSAALSGNTPFVHIKVHRKHSVAARRAARDAGESA